MTKIKVIDLDELYNFGIHHLYRWNHLMVENQVWRCHFLKLKNLNRPKLVTKIDDKTKMIDHGFRKF